MSHTVPFRYHVIFWICGLIALAGLIYLFQDVLLPFVLGAAVAYLLNPPVSALQKKGLPRWAGSLFLLGFFLLAVMGLMAFTIPVLVRELANFSDNVPAYINSAEKLIRPYIDQIESIIGVEGGMDLQALARQNAGQALSGAQVLAGGLAAGGAAMFNFFSILIVMPVVAFFLLLDWQKIESWGEDLLPRDHKDTILDLLRQINAKLSGFVRGQLIVAFILGFVYAVTLSFMGLEYGFLIGIGAGLLNIIPLVGSTIGLLVAVIVAWAQGSSWLFILGVAGIFLGGQLIEGNFLTPKFVGQSVGLHPLWVFFALMAGGALGGVVGMLIAVPVAAIAGVLIGFALRLYKKSPYYKKQNKSTKKTKKSA